MTRAQLVRRSLFFHWRGNLAILLGTAVASAVLTGALLVGDSLRGSLRARALERLGTVDLALVSGRFISQEVAGKLTAPPLDTGITLRASAEARGNEQLRRMSGVTVWATSSAQPVAPGAAWVSSAVSNQLGVSAGSEMTLIVGRHSDIPRESLLGRRTAGDTADRLTVRVVRVLAPDDPAGVFSLAPDVNPPANVFVSLPWLQEKLGQTGRVNVLLATGQSAAELQNRLKSALTLDDWGLVLRTPASRTDALFAALDRNKDGRIQQSEWRGRLAEAVVEQIAADKTRPLDRAEVLTYFGRRGSLELESRQMLLPPAIERAAQEAARETGLEAASALVYLANGISDGKATIPYSIVAAIAPQPAAFGASLKEDETVLADWRESPLTAAAGSPITVTFFDPDIEGQLRERSATFRLRDRKVMSGIFADPDLTPEFPGITDKLDLREWDPPFPYDNKRLQRRDDEYWSRFRTTPKAYISLDAARKLFGSRFGEATAIRLTTRGDSSAPDDAAAARFTTALLAKLDPAVGGFVFDDVRARALRASTGGQDFGMLFLGFSFFLIAAALILIGLLVRLSLDRRAEQIGILLATGFSQRQVRRLCVVEGLWIGLAGSLLGVLLATGFAALMLRLLASLWPDGSMGSFLRMHVNGTSLLIGVFAALLASMLAVVWGIRSIGRIAPSALLGGARDAGDVAAPRRWTRWLAPAALVAGIALLIAGNFVRSGEPRAACFFGGGALLLIASLAAVSLWMRRPGASTIAPGPTALIRLAARNTARNPTRSLLTAGLLAAATFLLVAVESFRRSPESDFQSRAGGSGGFPWLAECELPLYLDPGSADGVQEILDRLERNWREGGVAPSQIGDKIQAAKSALTAATIVPLRRHAGDDASCLNLYQPGRPRLTGVPRSLIERGGFSFAGIEAHSAAERENPWRILETPREDGAIPAFGEANTVQWMLKTGLGGTVAVQDGDGRTVNLRIAGLLHDSAFQGELLISDDALRRLFPRQEGFAAFLIDPAGRDVEIRQLLETAYAERGMTVSETIARLRGYLAVENTYLSTFQILGGFGLMLGAFGLAAVLLRNVWERRSEFALLQAVGYSRSKIGRLVFIENAILLLIGLGAGALSATISIVPQIVTGAASPPLGRLIGLLALVVVCGLGAGAFAVRSAVRAPLIRALRSE